MYDLNDLIGMKVSAHAGLSHGADAIHFQLVDGRKFIFEHKQECCEDVCLIRYDGMDNLIGSTIHMADKSERSGEGGFTTITTYTFLTDKGLAEMVWESHDDGCGGDLSIRIRVDMPRIFKGKGVPQ